MQRAGYAQIDPRRRFDRCARVLAGGVRTWVPSRVRQCPRRRWANRAPNARRSSHPVTRQQGCHHRHVLVRSLSESVCPPMDRRLSGGSVGVSSSLAARRRRAPSRPHRSMLPHLLVPTAQPFTSRDVDVRIAKLVRSRVAIGREVQCTAVERHGHAAAVGPLAVQRRQVHQWRPWIPRALARGNPEINLRD